MQYINALRGQNASHTCSQRVQLYTRVCFCEHGDESSVSVEGHECFVHQSNY